MQHLYTNFSLEKYRSYDQMVPHNYMQIAVLKGMFVSVCLWFGIKLWCGKYLEIDNFIVHQSTARKGLARS
jgi:hypothetical protein